MSTDSFVLYLNKHWLNKVCKQKVSVFSQALLIGSDAEKKFQLGKYFTDIALLSKGDLLEEVQWIYGRVQIKMSTFLSFFSIW